MAINVGKSACMRSGSLHNVKCANIRTDNSFEILWRNYVKYLGVDSITARVFFKCSYDNAKHKLLKTKCLPVLNYGLEVCPRHQVISLDYAVHNCFRKKISTKDHSVVDSMTFFECHSVHNTMKERRRKVLQKFEYHQMNNACAI